MKLGIVSEHIFTVFGTNLPPKRMIIMLVNELIAVMEWECGSSKAINNIIKS